MTQTQLPAGELRTITLEAPVTTVTLLEDRAQVQRRCQVDLAAGLWRVRVEQVAPVLVDKSLRAEFLGDYPEARIDDVRAHRHLQVKKQSPEPSQGQEETVANQEPATNQQLDDRHSLDELVEKLQVLCDRFNDITLDRDHQEHWFHQVKAILEKGLEELPVDAVWGQVDPIDWRKQIQTLFTQMRDLRRNIIDSYYTQEQLSQHIQTLIPQLQGLARPDRIYNAHIEADLMVAQAGTYDLAFDYVVPHALWRPVHRARLHSDSVPSDAPEPADSSTLSFQVEGCVWQRTGEDWTDVDLIFSTAQPSLGTNPPLLKDDLLRVQEKSAKIKVQARDQSLKKTGMTDGPPPNQVELPGVDDGGKVQSLKAATKATVPSDGQPYRVPLLTFDAPAQVEWVLVPELSCQVVLRSEHPNKSLYPLLAGPVDLMRTTEFVGQTTIPFIAPGEDFALGWGPDGAIRVQRTQEKEKEIHPETGWQTVTTTTTLYFSNIGAEERVIKVTERVPVSELEQVKVAVLEVPVAEPDENGFCVWEVVLSPYSQQRVELKYQITAAPDISGL